MKFYKTISLIAIALLTAGCAEERVPSDEADAWEISTDNTAPPTNITGQAAETGTEPPAPPPQALPTDVVAVVKGSAFKIDGTTETQNSTGDAFTVGHYFAASAPVELKTSATMIETDLEGRNIDGAVPLISIQLASTAGKYRSFSQPDARPIDGKQTLKDTYDIGPGSYKVTLSYYNDTVGNKRPHITLNSVTFRNLPASDN